jgi:phosphoglycerate dehydrogenase-like enzyme
VLSYILAFTQKHAVRRDLQGARHWDVAAGTPDMAADRTALILGTGGIGGGVAKTLNSIGMNCIGASRCGRSQSPFTAVERLDALPDLKNVDICIGALPLTPQTDGIMGAEFFARLKDALFINVGRGATADMTALTAALEVGYLRHAVLDVVPQEPLPATSPLWAHPKITITPHVSGLTLPHDTANAFVAAYHAIEQDREPALIVDPAAGY